MIKFVLESSIIRDEKNVKDVYDYKLVDHGVYFFYHTPYNTEAWVLFSNISHYRRHFAQIGKDTYQPEDIIKNPERIFTLMRQDSIYEALDKLPG